MLIISSILVAHAAMSLRASHMISFDAPRQPAPMVRMSMPPSLREQPGRISMPSELLEGITASAARTSASSVPGAIDVPANARAGMEPVYIVIDDEPGQFSGNDDVVYGARGVRSHGGYGPRRRVGAWFPRTESSDATSSGSIFDTTADDIHRRAQLSFYSASYPNLSTFEDAHRRAQLQFYRSTISPSAARSPDLLRHDRTNLRGPDLRRDSSSGRRW